MGSIRKKSAGKTARRDDLVRFLDRELRTADIQDSSRNGLQVQGAEVVSRIGLAVDACLDAYKAAADTGCQAVVAHHGMIWEGLTHITKATYRQLKYLFDHDLNLYAAHLPLDMHPKYGNNAQIADMLGLKSRKPFGNYKGTVIGFQGSLPRTCETNTLSARLEKLLGGKNVILPFGREQIKTVAVVSGGGGDLIDEAADKKIDCYITGEPGHSNHHLAREAGITVIYCGHYHSEKPGVIAIGRLLEKKFGIECVFLDVPTIV